MEPGFDGSGLVAEAERRVDAEAAAAAGAGDQGGAEIEVERGVAAPDTAPAGRQDLGAGAFVQGEEGDDFAEDDVGEVADAHSC